MQSMGRSRSMLAELLIVILFLSIAACTLVQLFAVSNETQAESRRTQMALVLARDALERFSAGEDLPGSWTETADGQMYALTSQIRAETAGEGALMRCEVSVCVAEQEYVRLSTARYDQGGAGIDG